MLTRAESDGFDVLIATDQNLRHQQNLTGRKIIFYQPVADGIEVLRVLYGAHDLHRAFDEMIGEPNPEDS